jgi:serine/threonine-protein kinase
VVLRGRCLGPARLVALEFHLGRQVVAAEHLHRFLVQGRILAGLDRSHLVPLFEVGEDQGQPYFTVTFVEGSLARQLASPTTVPEVIFTLVQMANAVQHAHQHDALRKRLHPARVVLDENMTPYLGCLAPANQAPGTPDVEALAAILSGCLERQPQGLTEFDSQVNAQVEVVALKCPDMASERRHATAADLSEELERWLRGDTVQARRVGVLPRVF